MRRDNVKKCLFTVTGIVAILLLVNLFNNFSVKADELILLGGEPDLEIVDGEEQTEEPTEPPTTTPTEPSVTPSGSPSVTPGGKISPVPEVTKKPGTSGSGPSIGGGSSGSSSGGSSGVTPSVTKAPTPTPTPTAPVKEHEHIFEGDFIIRRAATSKKTGLAYRKCTHEGCDEEEIKVIPKTKKTVTKPAKSKISSVTSTKKTQVKIKFQKTKNAVGYQIYYATDKKFTKSLKTTSTKKLTKTLKKLKSNKNYYIKIRAYNLDADGNRLYGKFSTAKKIKVK